MGLFQILFANECLSPVSKTPVVNSCHGFSVITGVVNTRDKFITGVNNTGEQLSLETVTPAKNLFPVIRTGMPWR
jgi:hypothetical protein